jgi:CMP-N,N'-diacetyllegionaminic acid synthase
MSCSTSEIIAIIPARGGSKRIPNKNLLPIGGRPLIAHTIEHAICAQSVNRVYVSTDHPDLQSLAEASGVTVVVRPPELASDTASSEAALLHVLDVRKQQGLNDPDLVVFLQCTCPIRTPQDIDRAIATLRAANADSLFSACRETPFIWRMEGDKPISVTYDHRARCRTQDCCPHFRENGSIYVCRPHILRKYHNRLGGKIAVYEMDYWSSFDIDTMDDVHLVQSIIGRMTAHANLVG